MDQHRLEQYRTNLEQLREELKRAVSAGADEIKPVAPDRAIGRLTRQDAILSQQMALELRRRNQTRLTQIERALERVAGGSYGFCIRCEEEISEARLKVRPEAPVCIDCAEGRTRE